MNTTDTIMELIDHYAMVFGDERNTKPARNDVMQALQQALAARVPDGWKHDCAALLQNDVVLWVPHCPHCGKPHAAAPKPAQQAEWVGFDELPKGDIIFFNGKGDAVEGYAAERVWEIVAMLREKNEVKK